MRAAETTVLNFIGGLDKVFIIPPFQRNYDWGEKNCIELFNDIVKACKTKKPHYLGNVVYYVGEKNGASYSEFILIDGQQRVTTVLLLLCALRDLTSEQTTKDSVDKRYLINDTGDDRFRIRLKQTSYDSQSFMSIIDKVPADDEKNNTIQNYNLFKKLIQASGISVKDLYEAIPKLEIVEVNIQIENDLSAVQTVFEKLNSTGKPLSPADLIRNFLLLANNLEEQVHLYENYWMKIERTVGSENISRFARDFLILNIFEDVPEKQIYSMFKEHFIESEAKHIDILNDMHKYSKYFAWIKAESCPNEKLNKQIKTLNYLKTEDLCPLYLHLLAELYDTNIDELIKIFCILSDFMLRYRIVAPSGGGGALRTVIHQLLEGLSSNFVNLSSDGIRFELSNSGAPSGRFPDDKDFKERLMNSVNTNYARVVLLKIEEYESKNISIPLDKVTIEHLLPQTLNEWWITNLGGKDEADKIHEQYIDSIGNLAPVSQGYNSSMSNHPWPEKIKILSNVQFQITSEIAAIPEWNEYSIIDRNESISNRACVAITSPLERTRKYQTKNSSNEFESGTYPVSDISTSMNGVKPNYIIHGDNHIAISTWKEYLCKICEIAHSINPEIFAVIAENNSIHKATSTKNYPEKDPIITSDITKLLEAKPIGNSDYYSEGTISSIRARVYAKQILDVYGITENFSFSIGN